jgi:hypothetical protein
MYMWKRSLLRHATLCGLFIAMYGALAVAGQVADELPAGAMQQTAKTACLECHGAAIILQQRLSKPAWAKEVDKMMKWGAVVDSKNHDALVDYMSANFGPDKPAYTPPISGRTSRQPAKHANHKPERK